jgi:hypothetical protein
MIRTNRYMFRHWSAIFRESTNTKYYKSNIKFGIAQKAKAAYDCQDTKEALYKTNSATCLNKVGETECLSPKCVKFGVVEL